MTAMPVRTFGALPTLLLLAACASAPRARDEARPVGVTVTGASTGEGRGEVVSVPWPAIAGALGDGRAGDLRVEDAATGALVVTQVIDLDADGTPEELLFDAAIAPGEERAYRVRRARQGDQPPAPALRTFGRFVPERMDDFAWENDVVAFRMYGPALAASTEDSGVDCWLKRVPYPIVDKWYREEQEGKSYHEDHGEGYDPYHVGRSRGCGGLGVWENGHLWTSNVYSKWKVLANGPLRTVFELTYAPWEVNGRRISEVKRITLDLHARFARFDSSFFVDGKPAPLAIAVGLTTHDGAADVAFGTGRSWMRCWEEIDGAGLGTGVLFDPSCVRELAETDGEEEDDGHALAVLVTDEEGRLTYRAGYGWARAGDVPDVEVWDQVLDAAAETLGSSPKIVLGNP